MAPRRDEREDDRGRAGEHGFGSARAELVAVPERQGDAQQPERLPGHFEHQQRQHPQRVAQGDNRQRAQGTEHAGDHAVVQRPGGWGSSICGQMIVPRPATSSR